MPTPLTDESLLASVRAGDPAAFPELVRRYARPLSVFLAKRVGAADAADVLQETFLNVFRQADRFDAVRRFRPWVYTIAKNEAVDFLRAHRRRADLATGGDDSLLDGVPALEAPEADGDAIASLRAKIDRLPPCSREAALLRLSGASYEGIGKRLGIPVGTVKSRLHGAVRRLREEMRRADGDCP